MGEDEGAHPVARRGLRGVGDAGVVVEHVHQAGEPELLDEVASDDGVDEHVGTLAQLVEPGTRHGVTGDDHRPVTFGDPVADGGSDRGVIGRGRR